MSVRNANSQRNVGLSISCSRFVVSDEISSFRNKGISLIKAKNHSRHFPALSHRIWECKRKSPYEASISSENERAMRKRPLIRLVIFTVLSCNYFVQLTFHIKPFGE
jgi:hypothetical protein